MRAGNGSLETLQVKNVVFYTWRATSMEEKVLTCRVATRPNLGVRHQRGKPGFHASIKGYANEDSCAALH